VKKSSSIFYFSLVSNAFMAGNFSIKSKAKHKHIHRSDNWWRALGFDISGRERLERLVDYLSVDVSSKKGNKDSTNI
jgi:hypothetical protein